MSATGVGPAPVAVVVVRDGRLPAGADEAVSECSGRAVVVGRGAVAAVADLTGAGVVWVAETGTDPVGLAAALAPLLADSSLIVLPASPDGRDLAPRLAAALDRPLLAGCTACRNGGDGTSADLLRADGRVTVTASVAGPAVATLWPGARAPERHAGPVERFEADLGAGTAPLAVQPAGLIEPDPATMDLAEAKLVLGGGAGLVRAAASDEEARAAFALLVDVAAAVGASAGATRVVTDAGWMAPDRQIGTTGVTLRPELYVALGVSGATQHTGGLGDPQRVASVNVDPACPMTAMADLGVVADAPALLVELAGRLGVDVPEMLRSTK